MRTSASWASWVASGKFTLKSYLFGLSGTAPPKESHRNSRMPKQDSAKATITTIRPRLGACLIICRPPPSLAHVRRLREVGEREEGPGRRQRPRRQLGIRQVL